jgi:hypothetical protein
VALIDQKLSALQEMRESLTQQLAQYDAWIAGLDQQAETSARS